MTIEEFRAKKQNILNSTTAQTNNKKISIDEFRKKKQQILSGLQEQTQPKENVSEKLSAPQTIQQKMDNLWEEEKQIPVRGGMGRSFSDASKVTEEQTKDVMTIGGKEYKFADTYLPNQTMLTDEEKEEKLNNAPLTQKIKRNVGKVKNTAEHIVGSAATGALQGAEGIAQTVIGTGGNFLEKINRDYIPEIDTKNLTKETQREMVNQLVYGKPTETSEKIKNTTEELVSLNLVDEAKEKLDKRTNSLYGKYNPEVLGVPVSNIASEAARMVTLAPTGLPGFMASAAGGNISEAINEGEELDNAVRYGAVSGAIEGGTEKMFDTFNILGGGVIDKFLPKSAIGKFITGSLGEGVEEIVNEAVNPFVKMATYEGEVDNPVSSSEAFDNYVDRIKDAGWQGFVMGMFMQGAHDISDAEVREQYKSEVFNAVEKVKGLSETQKKQMVDELVNASETSSMQLSEMENYINNYKNTSEYSKYIPTNQNFANNITFNNEKTSQLEKLVPTQKNDALQSVQNEPNNTANQITPTEGETAQNGNMEQTTQGDKVMDVLLGKKPENVNNIAKNDVLSYTNNRGDINGRKEIDQGRNQGNFAEAENESGYETNSERNSNINESKVRIAEQARRKLIQPQTNIEKQIFQKAKELGMNVYLYEKGSDEFDGFSAKDGVYIDKNGQEREEVLFSHELLHNLRQNNNSIFNSEIKPLIDELGDSAEFINVFDKFNSTLQQEIPLEQLAEAKEVMLEEIFADYTAKILANYEIDYNISNDMYNKLEKSLLKITQPFNVSADNESAFSIPENSDISKFSSSETPRPYMDLNKYISTNKDSKTNKVSLTDIQNAINDIVTVKTGKFRQQAYGIYKNQSEIIRLKQQKDIPVALHELTHHLDKKYNLSSSGKISNELKNIAVVGKNATEQTKVKEGVAEFGRYYMTNKEYAKEIAPFYYDAFETALDSDPVMKGKVEAIRQMVSDYLDQSPLNRFLSNIDKGDNEVSLWDDVKNKLIEAKKSFRKNFVDELDPLKKIIEEITNGKEVDINNDTYKLLRLNKGVTGRVRVALEYGIVDNNGNKIGKGLKEIIKPVADDIDGFIAYISALRAKDLNESGIESGFNKKDIDEVLKMYKENKTFENASKELYQFQNQILEKTLVDSGIITKEAMKAYNESNPHYVPFYRVMDENFKQSKDSMSKAPKKIKGSARDIINPLESIIKNTYSYMQLSEKNNAYKSLFNLANEFDGTGKWFDKVPTDMVGTKITANDVKDILEQLNLDKEDVDYNEIFTTMFKPSYNQKGNIITVMENGKPAHYEINDKELYDILAPANANKKENMLLTLMNKGSTALRVGATHSPEFILRNPIRDTLDAGIYSKNGFVPFVDTISGIFEMVGRSDLYYKWLESGGSGSTYTNAQRKALRNTLQELIPQVADNKSNVNKVVDILVNAAKHPLKTYLDVAGNISNIMEEGTRVGEFKKALNKTENLKESALESRSITVDFSRGGTQAKELNKHIAFLNAEIQGLDKMFSSFNERPVATTLKGLAYLTIPSIIIRALQDDDEMDKVPQWEKDTYWVFFIGDTPVKIPKPQGLGQLFATLPERAIDFIKTQDKEAFDGLLQRLMTSYMPIDSSTSLLPTAWQPLIENATNYSFFRQQPIVKQSLQNRSPKYQYDENTSTIAKTVGGALNVSPKKIDNLISGYGGNLGKDIANIAGLPIDIANMLVNGGKKDKEYSTFNSTLRKIPLIKGFVASDTASKELDNFYEEKSKINTLYTDTKFKYSGKELNNKQKKELEDVQALNKIYNSAYNGIKELNEQIDEIEKSNKTNKYKENKIEKLEEEIDKIAKETDKKSTALKELIPGYK